MDLGAFEDAGHEGAIPINRTGRSGGDPFVLLGKVREQPCLGAVEVLGTVAAAHAKAEDSAFRHFNDGDFVSIFEL